MVADKKRPGSRSSDAGDSHSEMTKSSAANTIDSLSTVDSSSIFDVEGTEESRNVVAMKGVRRLVLNIVLSFVLLLAGINVVFGMGSVFKTRELSDRNNILDAGLYVALKVLALVSEMMEFNKMLTILVLRRVRLSVLEIAWNARSMDLLLHNVTSVAKPQRTLPYLQGQITAAASTASTSITSIFGRTAESSSTGLLNYWQTPVITDPTVSTKLAPSQFLSHVLFKSLRLGSAAVSSLTPGDADVNWLVVNGLPDAVLTFVLDFVKVFQLFYEDNVRFRFNSLVASIIAISVIPAASFLVFFLPVWLRLSGELNASRRLFTRIPRRVAGVLCKEMQECLKEQLEREGADGTDVIRENGATNDPARDNTQQSVEIRGSEDDWNSQFGPERPGSRDLTMWRLLGMYVFTLLVITGMGIGLAYCYIRPLELARNRGSVINFSGLRLSMVVRSMTELRELSMLAPDDEQAEVLRSNILSRVDEALAYHSWTLYGNAEQGLPRTFGSVPEADKVTFSRTCPPTNASASCMSVEEALVTYTTITRRVVDRRLPVTARDYNLAALIAEPQGILRNPIVQARLVYSVLNQNEFNLAEIASIVIFSATFPSLFIVAYVLYRPLDDVAKMIRRVRGILFQLPTETLDPSIRDYLDHGWLRMNGKSWKGKKTRDGEKGVEHKTTRSHAVNEANRRLQEEGDQWDVKSGQDGTERQRKVKMLEVAAESEEEQEAESLVIERMMTRRSSSRVQRRPNDAEKVDNDNGSKMQLTMTGKEVSATASLSPTSPTGWNETFTRRRLSVTATLEPPGSPKATATRVEASLGSSLFAVSAHPQPGAAASFDQSLAIQAPSPLHQMSDVRSSNSLSVPNSAQRLDASLGSNAPSNTSLSNRATPPRSLGMTRNGSGNGSYVKDFNQLPHMLNGPGGSMQRDVSMGSRHGSLSRQGPAGVVIPSRLMNSLQRRAVTAAATAAANKSGDGSDEDE
ncbi:hypothetical protein BCR44DRAFT_1503500 [Catenaria anguillulae PL171]|uniref:Uncharacterized protein n=1 Tax=Catenaria anguillulae PL171 TaxID=765915 RepID=A0A1Y2HAL0_9FUNG|nr:hypothetical protein BCR44DRAFT_1503500 [Catenaria anguillulae PL171]